jgi:ABC-type sulfate transport system substrate-binding protein
MKTKYLIPAALASVLVLSGCGKNKPASAGGDGKTVKLLNVSYDPTREFYV